eukprot:SAG11_NODE_179_length_13323_cov_27.934286_2_plen_155_part_00
MLACRTPAFSLYFTGYQFIQGVGKASPTLAPLVHMGGGIFAQMSVALHDLMSAQSLPFSFSSSVLLLPLPFLSRHEHIANFHRVCKESGRIFCMITRYSPASGILHPAHAVLSLQVRRPCLGTNGRAERTDADPNGDAARLREFLACGSNGCTR